MGAKKCMHGVSRRHTHMQSQNKEDRLMSECSGVFHFYF